MAVAATNDRLTSQQSIEKFWKRSAVVGGVSKPTAILPPGVFQEQLAKKLSKRTVTSENALASYDEAVKICKAKIAKIRKECHRINQKYHDPYFDLENEEDAIEPLSVAYNPPPQPEGRQVREVELDFGRNDRAYLTGQINMPDDTSAYDEASDWPQSVKRVGDIFDNPQFYVETTNAKDIRQGSDGDCWFLSALAALCTHENNEHLIEAVCIDRDEDCGVYGFIFNRDGQWRSEVIDDKLFLKKADYDDSGAMERRVWEDNRIRVNSEEEYRRTFQTNSGALWFAQCSNPNETWVPLIEKAYAKAHGDYNSIESGYTGEGVEDLTGGVATQIRCSNILDKNRFWEECLMRVGKDFLFGCDTEQHRNLTDSNRQGLYDNHAYSILDAKDVDGHRLLKVKNPWGKTEWSGPWSDGSAEWTAYWIEKLGHTFGDDGVFWISYRDLLRKYSTLHQTRLFGKEWNVARQWVSLDVPWAGDYLDTKFEVTLESKSLTVIVLSKLDERYFRGLNGQYMFKVSFRLHKQGDEDYIVRTHGGGWHTRSASVETELEAGSYTVFMKIDARRDIDEPKVEDVVRSNWTDRREKLLRVGLSYDLAHTKGQFEDENDIEEPSKSLEVNLIASADAKDVSSEPEIKADGAEKDVPKSTKSVLVKSSEEAAAPKVESQVDIEEQKPEKNNNDSGPPEAERETKNDQISVAPPSPPSPPQEQSVPANPDDEVDDDPWSAVCVVGLRVYTKGSGSKITLLDPSKVSKGQATFAGKQLDVDDPAKDAAKETAVAVAEAFE